MNQAEQLVDTAAGMLAECFDTSYLDACLGYFEKATKMVQNELLSKANHSEKGDNSDDIILMDIPLAYQENFAPSFCTDLFIFSCPSCHNERYSSRNGMVALAACLYNYALTLHIANKCGIRNAAQNVPLTYDIAYRALGTLLSITPNVAQASLAAVDSSAIQKLLKAVCYNAARACLEQGNVTGAAFWQSRLDHATRFFQRTGCRQELIQELHILLNRGTITTAWAA